jgi:predicted nucleic acid-binding protein
VILVDTSGLIAAMFEDQNHHEECARILREDEGPLILSPFVFAEADYLVNKYGGIEAEMAFLEEIERGAYVLAEFRQHWLGDTRRMVHRYRDLNIGLTDAAMIMLAEHYNCRDVLTLDLRHYRAIRPISKKSFRILPADAAF